MLVLLPRVMALVNFFMGPPRTEDGRSIERRALMGGANNKRRNTLFCVHPQIPISVCIFCITLCSILIHPQLDASSVNGGEEGGMVLRWRNQSGVKKPPAIVE